MIAEPSDLVTPVSRNQGLDKELFHVTICQV